MRDWDTRISELKKNIEAARNRFVIPFLDTKYLEEQVVKDIKSKPTVNEKSETKEIDKNEETKDSKKTTDKDTQSIQPSQEEAEIIEAKVQLKEDVKAAGSPLEEVKEKSKKGRKKKNKEVKPDILATELTKLEAIKEEDLTEEQEDRLMELRRIKPQRLMHQEVDDQFQNEMKQADDEIKTLKSQLKIKDPLPKGYVEWLYLCYFNFKENMLKYTFREVLCQK